MRRRLVLSSVGSIIALLVFGFAAGAAAQDEPSPEDQLVIEGSEVYTAVCSACHGPTGAGQGSFPPLSGNPNTGDAAYVADVIRNGLSGPIEVNGVTYDAVMPAQTSLSDGDVDAVIAYIQAGFELPAGAVVEAAPDSGPSPTALPGLTNSLSMLAILAFVGVGLWVVGPELIGPVGPDTSWTVAWAKGGIIVVFFVVTTVVIPSVAMQTSTVGRLPRVVQDLVGSGLWLLGLVIGIGMLWWAKREKRI